ncbi:DUF6766 family protein [Streptomyces sp. NPDC051109]|uniref:DUF6766 family protein n=1 Tax=Streptomyces sp. NPDC051109 TaxID=3365642 RepID=UPI0037A96E79
MAGRHRGGPRRRGRHRLGPLPLGRGTHLTQPDLRSRTLRNWRSELLAVAAMDILSVYPRARGANPSPSPWAPPPRRRASRAEASGPRRLRHPQRGTGYGERPLKGRSDGQAPHMSIARVPGRPPSAEVVQECSDGVRAQVLYGE